MNRNGLATPQGTLLLAALTMVACGQPDPANRSEADSPPTASASPAPTFTAEAVEVFDDAGASLGSVALPVSCENEAATHVRRALALLHNMTHTEAETAFRQATEVDPTCALGYWGQAASWVHPVWPDVPSDDQFARGWDLLQEGRSAGQLTAQEEAWFAALEAYYRDGAQRTEPERLADYHAAWRDVTARYPDDVEARLFEALTLIATAPGSDTTFGNQIRAGELAESVLDQVPDHPGGHHYVIHAYDLPPLAERAIAAARSYGSVAPENAHALHMTSHIFTRLGYWDESIDFNRRSAAAALAHPINGATSHHYLHALDYLAYAYLQIGDDTGAARVVEDLEDMEGPVMDNVVSAYAFAAVPARIALERQDWTAAATVPVGRPERLSWSAYPHLESITQFARAMGAAHTGDLEAARAAVSRMGELRAAAAELPGSYDWATQVEIQRLAASAWTLYESGQPEEGLATMREAVALEGTTQKHPVTPGEALPASEILGDMLLDMGHFDEARAAYDAALVRSPNRLNSLYGSGRASELAGDLDAARARFEELISLQADAGADLDRVAHARALLASE